MKTSSLDSLARLHRWELDERRREIAELFRVRNELEEAAVTLETMLTREMAAATETNSHADFAAFADRIRKQQDAVAAHIDKTEAQIAAKQEEVAAAFQDVKRFEIMEERQLLRERKEADRREQAMLDEIGLNGHRQNQS